MRSLERVYLERAVHAGGGEVGGVLAEAQAGGGGGVLVDDAQRLPLPAQQHAHVAARHAEVRAAPVEAHLLDAVPLLQLDRLEVLQLPQIPQFDAGVLGRRGQVVAVLGERYGGDRADVSREVGDVALLLEVPDLDLRGLGAGAEDESVGVELRRGEADGGRVGDLGERRAGADVGEGPVPVAGRGQHVVAGGVQRESGHGALVAPEDHARLRPDTYHTRIKYTINNNTDYIKAFQNVRHV